MRNTIRLILGAAALAVAAPLLSAEPQGDEPVAVPTNIKQGIDFVYVDPQMSSVAQKRQRPRNWLTRVFRGSGPDQSKNPNPFFNALSNGLQRYEATWGALPQVKVPAGPSLKTGATGKRVTALRTRLGLPAAGGYDAALTQRVSEYQRVHALAPVDGIVGKGTLTSLNLGAQYYEKRIAINMERAWRLPQTRTFDRYVVVDSGAAETYLFDQDRVADSMRVVVGAPATKTPMMAVLMRDAKVHPYWNVPPDLVRSLTAKRIREQGLSYLDNFHYEVLTQWTANAPPVDPRTIDWKAVEAGKVLVRARQLPGPWNSMGEMKFQMPNDFGIYLHDTPHKELFANDERHLSNGCIRLADYRRFATWVFGRVPQANTPREQLFQLPKPVPVYMTYLTVEPAPDGGIQFRPDPYGWVALGLPQMDYGGPFWAPSTA
jgi:murein L,D-transpeptidase YcbB/YkuD